MPEFNFIKNFHLTLIKFGGDKKVEVGSGEKSGGAIVLSSSLESRAIDLSKNSAIRQFNKTKSIKNPESH